MIAMTAIPVIKPSAYHGYVTQSHLNVMSPLLIWFTGMLGPSNTVVARDRGEMAF